MNKSKIEWCDYTWNPVTGCLHNCDYCYAKRIAERFKRSDSNYQYLWKQKCYKSLDGNPFPVGFEPTFYPNRLNEPANTKKPSKIFVCSMADLFGDWVPTEWQLEVYKACGKADWHKYMFLTKNPKAYSKVFYRSELDYRYNFWLGTTVTDDKSFNEKGYELFVATGLDQERHAHRFLSIEPLLGEITDKVLRNIQLIDWAIIGAETGNSKGKVVPKREWVESMVEQCKAASIPVFMKNSLKDLMGDDFIQEWPEGLR